MDALQPFSPQVRDLRNNTHWISSENIYFFLEIDLFKSIINNNSPELITIHRNIFSLCPPSRRDVTGSSACFHWRMSDSSEF